MMNQASKGLQIGAAVFLSVLLFSFSVWAQGDTQGRSKKQYEIEIIPAQVEVDAEETVQFTAQALNREGAAAEVEIEWSVLNKRVGEIDENGLFTAIAGGHTHVIARAGRSVGKAEVIVRRDSVQNQNLRQGLRVVISPNSAIMDAGETCQFSASLVDSSGETLEAAFDWGVDGDFGIVDETGLFEALEAGRGFVYATTGDISGRAHVVVMNENGNHGAMNSAKRGTKMVLVPNDTIVLIENVVQFQAFLEDTLGNQSEVYPEWEMVGRDVGSIDESGLFTASTAGNGVVKASLERYTATARVRVATTEDTANAKNVEFKMKKRDGEQIGNMKRIKETDVFKISGMPFPLNLLNGAEVTLPAGALEQDITIDVSIPSIAGVKDTTVSLPEAILNGISFDVYVDGELVSPFVFDEPVQLVIPYKQEMMNDMGLTLDDLWVFFYTDKDGYDSDGLFNIYVDTTENKIIVEVSHFSEIVIGDKKLAGTTGVESQVTPDDYALYANYPNPFNPVTSIRFYVSGTQMQHLTLTVYNLLGQKIRVLTDREFAPGFHQLKWDGTNQHGQSMSSGVYLYQLEGQNLNLCRQMVLIR
ncbi:Ig-like domain-containing protein [bacterium]|nr:Ig-like domain-containing protein [bacterium]